MKALYTWRAVLMGALIAVPAVHAADPLEDVDVEAEEVMTEGEAAQEVVKMQKDELRQERRQLKELESTARNARVTAMLRKRDANRQLMQAEREYKDIVTRKNRLNKEMARDTQEMLRMERRLEDRKAEVEKVNGLLSASKEAARDKRQKLEEIRKQNREADRQIDKHKRNMHELTQESGKLSHLLKVSQAEKAELDRETKRLKQEFNKAKVQNSDLERRLAKQKDMNERSRDHLKWAKEQTKRRQLAGRRISKR